MGTRGIVTVKDEDYNSIIQMYTQYDGYFDGFGKDLAEYLSTVSICNGYSTQKAPEWANGFGCLAAQLVVKFKEGIGGIYLLSTEKESEQYYNYEICPDNKGQILFRAFSDTKMVFEGAPKYFISAFLPLCDFISENPDIIRTAML